ncbi:MAG: hypothetical protein AB8I08_29130 [Sandaracinaceae bacterium]
MAWSECVEACTNACRSRLDGETPTTVEGADAAARCGRGAVALRVYEQLWANGTRGCALSVSIADRRAREVSLREAVAFAEGAPACRDLDLWIARAGRRDDGLLDSAARAIARRVAEDPDDTAALIEQVERWLLMEQPALAEPTCARAVALGDAWLHDACARAAAARGEQHAAERHFRSAVAVSPNAAHWDNLGHFLLSQRRRPEAADAFRSALGVSPDDYDAMVGLGAALLPECWDGPRQLLERAMRAEPNRPDAYLTYGQMTLAHPCANVEDSLASITALRRFVRLAGDDPSRAADVERVTRRCRRADRSGPRRGLRSEPWADGCEPGFLQRHQQYCSSQIADMRAGLERAGSEAARCEVPTPAP